ncbi:hypothetical protein ACHAWT_008567 [Skeletonema menzelii]
MNGFNDDLDWASAATPSGFTPTNFGANTNVSKITSGAVNEEFLDDFDDDDDMFFSSAVGGGASAGLSSNGGMKIDTTLPTVDGGKKSSTAGTLSSFGMMTLSYSDASAALVTPPNRARPTSIQGDTESAGGDDISGDLELMDLDQKHLSSLRDPASSFRDVARSCLVCQQLTQSPNIAEQPASALSSLEHSIRIQSASIYHIQRYQRFTHRILSSLTTCISTHNESICKSLAASTLASTARASYARLHFDTRLFSVRLAPSIATRLEDECGNGVAHTLVVAAIEQGDDAVSSASFEALGRLTLDPNSDELAAEVRSIAENVNSTVFSYESDSGTFESFREMREMQSKVWEHVLFPRMQRVLHRLSLYSSTHHLAKAIPVITAACVHALTQGPDTVPARRTMLCGKSTHAKRGWVESDAERLVTEFVERILLPCFVQSNNKVDDVLKRSAAVACIRLSSACPLARWRVRACRNAAFALSQQVDEIVASASSQNQSVSIAAVSESFPHAPAVESLSGTAAILLIALRGIPVNERAPGLASVLMAALLFFPVETASYLDLKESWKFDSLSRVGLLSEVALSVMLDGSNDAGPTSTEVTNQGESKGKEKIVGTRSILLSRILHKNNFNASPAVDALVWIFCSMFIQIGEKRNYSITSDLFAASDWSDVGLVLLDNFASYISTDELSNSPFTSAAIDAYSNLLTDMLKRCAVFPPSSFSLNDSMFAVAEKSSVISNGRSVVEIPTESSSRVALVLFKLTQALTLQRSKIVPANTSFESIKMNVRLNATLCDAWFGQCIANNDAKQSNQGQLDTAFELLSLFRSDMMTLLQMVGDDVEMQPGEVLHLLRICIAGVETVACVSEVISYGDSLKTNNETADATDEKVAATAISALSGVFNAAKELAATSQQRSWLCQQVAVDSSNTASRISAYIRDIANCYHDDIVTALQPSNLGRRTTPLESPSTETGSLLYHHARLALDHRTNLAIEEYSPTKISLLPSKAIHPFNPLRMNRTLSHSSIQVHQLVRGLPLLIPERAYDGVRAVSLTGSSDPVSLVMSPSIRQVRKSDSNERMVLVVTMRLYNITPVPLERGVRLDVAFDEDGNNSVCTTSLYNNQIDAGDCTTWEILLEDWKIGDISLRATITFLGLEKESISHKWLYGGEQAGDLSGESPLVGDDDEGTMDVAIHCEPTSISSLFTLQPCPLVFFPGHKGDEKAFIFLWSQLDHSSQLMFINSTPQEETAIDAKRGRVTLSNGATGCAFIAPGGDRILCTHQINQGGSHSLLIKSNSSELISSLVGTLPLKTSLLRFIFGGGELIVKEGSQTNKNLDYMKHDFPSITMKHSPINAF